MDGYLTAEETAAAIGVARTRIHQLIRSGQLPCKKHGSQHLVARRDVETLLYEQSLITVAETCRRVNATRRQLILLVEKGVLHPRNKISKLRLFDPDEIDDYVEEVKHSLSIDEAAVKLRLSLRQTYRLVEEGTIRGLDTPQGLRIPQDQVDLYNRYFPRRKR